MLTDYQRYRLYEILPGLSVWLTLILAITLSITNPVAMIYAVIVFDVYWVLKVLNFSFYLIVAWFRYRRASAINWRERLLSDIPKVKQYRHLIFLTLYNEEWAVVKTSLQSILAGVYDPNVFTVVIAGEERTREHYQMILKRAKAEFGGKIGEIIGTMHPIGLPD